MGAGNSRPAEPVGVGAAASDAASTCPVPERYRSQAVYNVYNQRIDGQNGAAGQSSAAAVPGFDILDPKNNMPLEPNQQPCPGQKKLLSTDRVQSNIPKGGTDSTWIYPSPQMFYNGEFGETPTDRLWKLPLPVVSISSLHQCSMRSFAFERSIETQGQGR